MLVDMSEEAHIGLQWAKAELKNVLAIKEHFWSQKSRVKWLKQGD